MANNAQKDPKCLISMELSIFGYSLVSLQPGIMMQQCSKALKVATKPLNTLVNFFTLLKALESENYFSLHFYGNINFLSIIHLFMLKRT